MWSAGPAGLPPAYTEVAQLDMFRGEDLACALRLGHPFINTGTSLTRGITGTGAADPLTWLRLARCPC